MNASGSQRSSLTRSSSIFSRNSHNSTDSYTSARQAAPSVGYQAQPAETDCIGNTVDSLPQTSQEVYDSPYPNQASPYAPSTQIDLEKHYCLTCKKCYTDRTGLKNHRKEQCEITQYWLCLHCLRSPTQRWFFFRREYRLHDHHRKEHEGGPGPDIDDATKQYPKQKAWGCPCCQACFPNRTDWHSHEKQHVQAVCWEGKNGDALVNGWSWETLSRSLLFGSSCLKDAANSYDWRNCNWRQGGDTWKELKFVLERFELPPDVARHHEQSPMRTAEDVVSYAHQILSTGSCDFRQLPSSVARNSSIPPILSNYPSAGDGTNDNVYQHLRVPTPNIGHRPPRSNQYSAEHEQMPIQQAGPLPFGTNDHPLYNKGLQQIGLHDSAYPISHSGAITQQTPLQSFSEFKKLKGKLSFRKLRASPMLSKAQASTAPIPLIPLAAFQAAAEMEALTPQHIFVTQYLQGVSQDESADFPMATQSSGNHSTWFDPTEGTQQGQYP